VVRLSDDFIDGFQATFLYMRTDFIRDNRDAAVGFVRAYVRANRDLAADDAWSSDLTARVLEDYTSIPAEINKNAARPYYPVNGTINVGDLATLQQYFLDRNALSYDDPLEIDIMLDTSLLDEVVEDIGEVEEEAVDEETATDDSES
jgi:ABC-type nitrate/sulfonate/bicarbonate transport system substrate-binding protein